MTQPNVMVSDVNTGLNMAISSSSSNSSMFTPTAHKPPAAPSSYIPIPRRKVLKNLEINAWVDSMRASSPTHAKSTPSLLEEHSSWIVSN